MAEREKRQNCVGTTTFESKRWRALLRYLFEERKGDASKKTRVSFRVSLSSFEPNSREM